MAWNLSYRCFGPTTVHLRHELYLLLSLALLEYASSRDLRFTALVTLWLSRNLLLRWFLTSHDTRTSASERSLPFPFFFVEKYHRFQFHPIENAIHFITTTVFAGQTFDRPNPHVVAKSLGTTHGVTDLMVETDLGAALSSSNGLSSRSGHRKGRDHHHHHGNYHGSSLYNRSYTDLFLDWVESVVNKLREMAPSSLAAFTSEAYWTNLLRSFGPSPQLLLQISTLLFLYFCWFYPLGEHGGGFLTYFTTIYTDLVEVLRDIYNIAIHRNIIYYYHYGKHDDSHGPLVTNHALVMEPLGSSAAMGYSGEITIDNTRAHGAYQHTVAPTWIDLWYYLTLVGTCGSLLLYGRVLLPIPDLVAGNGAGKETKASLSASGGGKGSRGGSFQKGGGSTSGGASAGSGEQGSDRPWLEQYQSIVGEHRLKLIGKVALIRLAENLFLVAILPRTDLACRTTGQCPNKSGRLELAKVIFFAGITSPLRSDSEEYLHGDGRAPFSVGDNPFRPDVFCAMAIGISVVAITLSLLLAQAATLNRSHLGITGYLAGGWVVDDQHGRTRASATSTTPTTSATSASATSAISATSASTSLATSDHTIRATSSHKTNNSHKKSSSFSSSLLSSTDPSLPPEWVARKRYKKGDRVTFDETVYKATTNHPEGCPYDFYLNATHKLFRNELGHPATSRLIAWVSTVQFGLISSLIVAILACQLFEWGETSLSTSSSSLSWQSQQVHPLHQLHQQHPGEATLLCLLWTLAANLVAVYGTLSVAVPDYSEFERLAEDIMK
mmetsp:Transcript_24101/g.66801  ORF Transcript_24101/g.66801 Transcript_24101/m.66801 type:complete len:780 (-) Transcript_24101:50-2389(-)